MALPPPSKGYPSTGAAYVGQMEQEYLNSVKLSVCSQCMANAFQKPMRRCNGCKLVYYCSTDCQKEHWPKHKAFCNMAQGKGMKNGYLTSLKGSELVYRDLIDSYRERVQKDHDLGFNHGIHYPGQKTYSYVWADGDAIDDFQVYLDLAEESGILPEWWRFENRMECLAQAVDESDEGSIFEYFSELEFRQRMLQNVAVKNLLRILAELVVGFYGNGRDVDGAEIADFKARVEANPADKERLLFATKQDVAEQKGMVEMVSKIAGMSGGAEWGPGGLTFEEYQKLSAEAKNDKEFNKWLGEQVGSAKTDGSN